MNSTYLRPLILAACLGLVSGGDLQAEDIDEALQAAEQRTRQNQDAQQRIDAINDDVRAKVAEFQALQKEIDGLEIYNDQLRAQLGNQQAELDELQASIDKVTLMERQVSPLMLRMIDTLEEFIALDVPFLVTDRMARVERLRTLLERSDVSVSEKFRNVMEAWQAEVEYGRTIEAYRGNLDEGGGDQEVDFLRVGRIGLLYLSLDGNNAGRWNASRGEWEQLPSRYAGQINRGLRIAREQAAPDLLRLPLPTPENAR